MSTPSDHRGAVGAMWTAAWLQAKMTMASPLMVAGWIITPVMLISLLTLPREQAPVGAEATQIVSAVLLAAFWAGCVWGGVGIIRRERQNGTLAPSLTGARDGRLVVIGKIAGACAISFAGVATSVTVMAVLLGLRPEVLHPWAVLAGLWLAVATGIAASLLIGCLLIVSRHGNHIANALGVPVTLFGGTVIAPEVFPSPLHLIPRVISLSWLQKWITSSATTGLDVWALGWAFALTVTYAVLGLWMFQRVLRQARIDGSLELV